MPEEVRKKASKLLAGENDALHRLQESIEMISTAFNGNIRFVVMKTLWQYPHSVSDIDLLIDEEDINNALAILEKSDYNIYRGVVPQEPYKIRCVSSSGLDVDIYPKVSWRNVSYLNENSVLRRRRFLYQNGVKVYLPSEEDELLILYTHSFSHCRVRLGDIFHIILMLQKKQNQFDWNYVLKTAEMYGTIPVLFRFLHLIHIVSVSSFGKSVVDSKVLGKFQKLWIIRMFNGFLQNDFFGDKIHPRNRAYFYIPSPILLLITMIHGMVADTEAHNLSLLLERLIKGVSHIGRLAFVILGIYS